MKCQKNCKREAKWLVEESHISQTPMCTRHKNLMVKEGAVVTAQIGPWYEETKIELVPPEDDKSWYWHRFSDQATSQQFRSNKEAFKAGNENRIDWGGDQQGGAPISWSG